MNFKAFVWGLTFLAAGTSAWAQAAPSRSRAIFDALDRNHDGFVSIDEFHKDIVASWQALDLNHDGFISDDELQTLPSRARSLLLSSLKHADANGDHRITFKEVVQARMQAFDAADSNHDDRLSLNELLAYEARLEAKPAAKPAVKAARH
ncbi:EF-hand domain-containing protein [Paucibacter sp. APW11]|uniref:EF-hand domain-containing protein n=1 Tax=Roseateles aquae TaxID=3077235 RepID=A0ABU3P8X8_9BURK|nr:EF-hand domain-containing protein [Paucibacter sp. APW11]MDT8999019.1 EF-hand domain-containing protein [Paucibacter sp. APW11]